MMGSSNSCQGHTAICLLVATCILLSCNASAFVPRGHLNLQRHKAVIPTFSRGIGFTRMVLFHESGQEEEQKGANSTSATAPPDVKSVESEKKKKKKNGVTEPTSTTNTTKIEGIGGKGGVVYDVNRLKRNLLQETMSAYKEELFPVLSRSTPTDDADIVEKLFALVQASPVRTTTDSNILDTEDDWVLAYRSYYPNTVASLVLYDSDKVSQYNARYNFLWNQQQQQQQQQSSSPEQLGKKENVILSKITEFFTTKHRCFRLEDLEDDEDAYVTDTSTVFGGLFTKAKHYSVQGLSRSSIELQAETSKWSLLGFSSAKNYTEESSSTTTTRKQTSSPPRMTVSIIYLDNDLCILSEQGGPDSPFYVYTRSQAYLSNYKTLKRKLKIIQAALKGVVLLPLKKARLISDPPLKRKRGAQQQQRDPILREIVHHHRRNGASPSAAVAAAATRLRVLRLGDIGLDPEDDYSWESASDPFVHLSADERQRLLKAMSVQQIEQAADAYRNSQRRFRWIRRLVNRRRRKTYFKKPSNSDNRGYESVSSGLRRSSRHP